MRYHYKPPKEYMVSAACTYKCDHPMYSRCTLYRFSNRGLAVVQKRFNPKMKVMWWGPIDPWLVDEIFNQERFMQVFDKHAGYCDNGRYPTMSVRKLMWALRMKPMVKQPWEDDIFA